MKNTYSIRRTVIAYIVAGFIIFHFIINAWIRCVVHAEDSELPTCRIVLETESNTFASQSEVKVYYLVNQIEDAESYTAYRKVNKTDGTGTEITIKDEEEILLTANEEGVLEYQEIFRKEDENQGEGSYTVIYYLQDTSGNKIAEDSASFIIDATAPEVSLSCDKADEITKDAVTCNVKVTELYFDDCDIKVHTRCVTWSGEEKDMCITKDDAVFTNDAVTELTFQEEGIYTVYLVVTDVAGNIVNTCKTPVTFTIDKTAPVISDITYSDVNGVIKERNDMICSNKAIMVQFVVKDQMAGVNDQNVYITVGEPMGEQSEMAFYNAYKAKDNQYYVHIPTDMNLSDFNNFITIWAADHLGNITHIVSKKMIYSTSKPQINMYCDMDYSVWTNQDITFDTTITDNISGLKEVIYRVNGKIVKKAVFSQLTYSYDYKITATESASKVSGYTVLVEAINNCGTKQTMKRQVYIDKEDPKVHLSGVDRGMHYNADQIIRTDIRDVSYKNTKTIYYITRMLDGKTYQISEKAFYSKQYEDNCNHKMVKQGYYEMYAIATDSAGNTSKSNTLSFVIDKTEPKTKLFGVEEGTISREPLTLKFECMESFYINNKVNIRVEKTLDGKTSANTIEEGFKKKKASMEKTFSEDGTYKVTFSAVDKAGNVAKPLSVTFSIDRTKPEIRVNGTQNYQQWAEPVSLQFVVKESYYSGNRVVINGTRTDENGNVHKIEIPQMKNTGKISSVSRIFSEDGLYDIAIDSKDEAGNQERKQIQFTVDQTEPKIEMVNQCDGKYYKRFQLANSLDEIFHDLTVTSHQILLNGVEYNGTDVIEKEGKYNLYVEAEDELGHKNSQNIEFIIDHTPPKVIFTGVRSAEIVNNSGVVNLALADTDDIITAVRMNGVDYGADTRQLVYNEYGAYRIEVDCEDKAGNQVTRSIYFIYNNPKTYTSIICVVGFLAIIVCAWILIRVFSIRKEKWEI